MIDKLICENISNNVLDDDVAVLLSGGVDSISVALAAQSLGKNIHAYSFYLDNYENYDYNKAYEISKVHGWKFTGIVIDTSKLEEDWYRLVELGCKKKTHYECVYPFMYVYPKIKEKYVLSGWAADGYFGVSKKALINYKHTKEKFDEFRDNYFLPENQAGYLWHKKISDKYDKIFITPYLTKKVRDYFYSMDWYELNEPYQKHHVRTAVNIDKDVKKHLNLQLESGVNVLFETLLNNRKINFKNRNRMLDVYSDWKNPPTTNLERFL